MTSALIYNGFSKLTRNEKLDWLRKQADLTDGTMQTLHGHLHPESSLQEIYDDISENTVSNYFLPFSLAPNFLINGDLVTVPMVTEESSVVAAASHSAKFWAMHGGFHAEVKGNVKVGQVHFTWTGAKKELLSVFNQNKEKLISSVKQLTHRMERRGGGVDTLEIHSANAILKDHYHLFVRFRTAEAMGANFINSVLEGMAGQLAPIMAKSGAAGEIEVIMSILSNYTPECLVQCYVEGGNHIFEGLDKILTGDQFARKFKQAVDLAIHDPYRAVTHNKGIFNGLDSVIMATGNDFRAVEACGHAYASRKGNYGSLSWVDLSEGSFRFTLEIPLAVGSVGGITRIHPMAGVALKILGNPSSQQLMMVVAAAGLANNFSAVRSLITAGIQQGHMKMHLGNILRQLEATPAESNKAVSYFTKRTVTHAEVHSFLESLRNKNQSE